MTMIYRAYLPLIMSGQPVPPRTQPLANETWKMYYAVGNQVVAMRSLTSAGSVLYYLHSDHLGSTSLATDAGGAEVPNSRQLYYPYGELRVPGTAMPTDIGFTGQRLDRTGLMFYQARYYSPVAGRFASADTMVPSPSDPQQLNRYAYGLNNPVKYLDPTGHNVDCSPWDSACREQVEKEQEPPEPPLPPLIPPPLATDPDYSLWYGGRYSGCTLCHYAVGNDKTILTNFELLDTDFNARKTQIIGQTVMLVSGGAVVIVVVGKEVIVAGITSCAANESCRNEIGSIGGRVINFMEHQTPRVQKIMAEKHL